jgi:hypothetical protein
MRLVLSSSSVGVCLGFVVALSGCDLFGQVACQEDADCPDALPFCNSDFCEATADDGRPGRGVDGEGEGEGEGEGGCSGDADCAPAGLCDLDGSFGAANLCLPPAGTEDCAADSGVQARARDAAGPVIFGLAATSIGDGCFANVSFTFFDREGDVSPTSPLIELVVQGAAQTQSPPFSEDGKTFSIGTMCGGPAEGAAGLQLLDGPGNASNTLCLRALP